MSMWTRSPRSFCSASSRSSRLVLAVVAMSPLLQDLDLEGQVRVDEDRECDARRLGPGGHRVERLFDHGDEPRSFVDVDLLRLRQLDRLGRRSEERAAERL